MLNINNLNRVRRVLSAQNGAKAPSTPNIRIKYLGRLCGGGYRYAISPTGAVEDWSEEHSFRPPEEYYEQQTGDKNFDNLEYAEGLGPENIDQQSYIELEHGINSRGEKIYYGITSSGKRENITESKYNQLRSTGILDRTTETQASQSTSLSSISNPEQPKGFFAETPITEA